MKKRIKKYIYIAIFIAIYILYNKNLSVQAKEIRNKENSFKLDDYIEYNDVQKVIDDVNLNINFKETVEGVVSGQDIKFNNSSLNIIKIIKEKIRDQRNIVIKVIFICILTAIFTNFTRIFDAAYVSQTAFMVVYMVLVTVLITSFYQVYMVAFNVVNILKGFMQVLMPVYTIASFISTGLNTATGYSQLTLIIILIVEIIFLKIFLPLINIYMITNLINNINSVDALKRLSEFFKMIVMWGLKTSIILVTGMGTVKKIIAPSVDTATKTFINNGLKMTPFLGGNISGVSDTVTSATTLIKDAIGGVSLVVIGIICLTPLISIGVYIMLYMVITIIIESIADKRVTNALDCIIDSAKLLLYIVMVTGLLFIITIALLTV